MRTLQCHGLSLLLVVSGFGASLAAAQAYPSKPIRIHTAGPGSGADIAARLIAPEVRGALGQPVIVENRSTATLALGVSKAAPDGHTLLFWGGAFWLSPLLQDVPYDPLRDFAPIASLMRAPTVLVVNPSLAVKSVKDLIALAKASPGKLNYASAGTGTASHLGGELFKSMADINFLLVKYAGGSAQSTADLLSGVTQFTIGPAAALAPIIKAGKIRGIATSGSKRSKLLPEFPTIGETLPGYEWDSLFGAFAPAKTPESVIRQLNQEILRALDKPDVRDRLLSSGYETAGSTPEELHEAVRSEMARVGKLVKDAGIKAD